MTFSKVYEAAESNVNMFIKEVEHQVPLLLEGQDFTFLVTGGTNAGKSHLLFGNVNDNGMLILFLNSLFKHLDRSSQLDQVTMSVMEFRSGGFFDVLSSTG